MNYVFGGYSSSVWNRFGGSILVNGSNCFIRLRKEGEACKLKFLLKSPQLVVFGYSYNCSALAGPYNIYICENSNVTKGSFSNLRYSNENHDNYLMWCTMGGYLGGDCERLTTEIEVYQIF